MKAQSSENTYLSDLSPWDQNWVTSSFPSTERPLPHLGQIDQMSSAVLHSKPQNPHLLVMHPRWRHAEHRCSSPPRDMKMAPQLSHSLMWGASFHLDDLHEGHMRTSSELLPVLGTHLYPHLRHCSLSAGWSHLLDWHLGHLTGWFALFLQT